MTVCSGVADYRWLTEGEACAVLDEIAADSAPLHTAAARLRKRFSTERTHLLLEQVGLRRRAAAKFTYAARMFFTRVGLEQATDEWVAAYKAARFAERAASSATPAVLDLCCGIGGDLIALTGQQQAIGVDCNPIAAHFAAVNSRADVRLGDVDDFDLEGITAWHIDPDRRSTGRRTTSIEACQPGLQSIERLLALVPHAAVKLAPATVAPAEWAARCELEWISRDRECRQLVAWHGDLARFPGSRRATILPTVGSADPRTVIGAPDQSIPIVERPDRYVFDVDAAVLAARLKGVIAAEHSLSAFEDGPTYLTGPRSISDAAIACFEVAEVVPFKARKLAQLLRELAIGQLEIKKRGVELEPEKLRRELKLRGDNAATLLVCRVSNRAVAIIAQRMD